ncbi:MAG: TonB-dependent receptor, partial [Calditrichaeota bacterium]|nr:TonB-dependent receptor [Calditrichota bacterium]
KFRLFSFISDNFQVTTGLNLDNYQSSYETTDNLFQSTVFFDSRFSQSRSVVFNLGSGIQKNRNKISLANTRIAFSSQVADHLNMSIAYSKAFENVSQVSGDFESSWLLTKWALGSNYNIYPEATHLSFDTNWNLDTGKEIAVTIYQKKIFDISNTNFFLTEINTKRTSSQGINLSYHQLLKNLDFTTTYNFEFYNIIVDANLVYGIVSRDYRKHSFKSLLKYQLGDWFFNLNYVRVFSKQIDLYREKSQTISELWPFYEKLDLGIQRKIYLGEMNCEMSLTLNNIFDRKQIQTELLPLQYIDVFLKKELALQGFTALFSFKLSF